MIKLNKDFLAGAVIGFGAGFAARSAQGNAKLRDVAKDAVKWGIVAARGAQTKLVELKETLEDITAEAKSEVTPVSAEAMPDKPKPAPIKKAAKEKIHVA
jgi:hypothetical protein